MTMKNMEKRLLSTKEAAEWASIFLGRPVTQSNIQYLVQYAKIKKYLTTAWHAGIDLEELKEYYEKNILEKQENWKKQLGKDLDWSLSFAHLREADTTKHVHRLHPYKGKFIPQLVEYFLDQHINTHKKEVYFREGDTIIDPFAGSGTTLVQSAELGLNSIGIDISDFNCTICKVKLDNYNLVELEIVLDEALKKTKEFSNKNFNNTYEFELKYRINKFNNEHFPNPEFKYKVYKNQINEAEYSKKKLGQFLDENKNLLEKGEIKNGLSLQDEEKMSKFLTKWFSLRIRQELFFYLNILNNLKEEKDQNIMKIVLSRTARSCRATTHSDLATLKEPQIGPYYCYKHKKICSPIDSVIKHLIKNTYDTLSRIKEFSRLKKDNYNSIISGDSKEVNVFKEVKKQNPEFYDQLSKKKIDGVFTSPPYVGQIDYHEQHAYAYELFEIGRKDEKEIGPLFAGNGIKARESYVEGISKVFINMNKFLKDDANIFVVANDKYNLYPLIAEKSGLKIVNKFKRPVLNRTERDRNPYAEIIFHMKKA